MNENKDINIKDNGKINTEKVKKILSPAKKRLRLAVKAVSWTVVGAFLLLALYMLFCSLTNRVAFVFGYGIVRIQTGSMEPTIMTGDYILLEKPGSPEDLREGDVITFNSSELGGALNTHRIISIEGEGQSLCFRTKGDHNLKEDDLPAGRDDVVAVYRKQLPAVTAAVSLLSKGIVFFLLVMVPALALFTWSIVDIAKKKKAIDDKKRKDAYNAIVREEAKKLGIPVSGDDAEHTDDKQNR